ncbi:hypothetical protein PPACK8108_LOCUS4338 [Phakopsora pachyrhizi]|uniref:Uncharacterized protein n=1 Tax=Phakopsora pachyrhizi TaxID=170000 RepID=A0AAV0APH4_PHAPC|nr:hypothetical protein PPACK8108_LOCUS4338 [Phakopsora pachyrhizi]
MLEEIGLGPYCRPGFKAPFEYKSSLLNDNSKGKSKSSSPSLGQSAESLEETSSIDTSGLRLVSHPNNGKIFQPRSIVLFSVASKRSWPANNFATSLGLDLSYYPKPWATQGSSSGNTASPDFTPQAERPVESMSQWERAFGVNSQNGGDKNYFHFPSYSPSTRSQDSTWPTIPVANNTVNDSTPTGIMPMDIDNEDHYSDSSISSSYSLSHSEPITTNFSRALSRSVGFQPDSQRNIFDATESSDGSQPYFGKVIFPPGSIAWASTQSTSQKRTDTSRDLGVGTSSGIRSEPTLNTSYFNQLINAATDSDSCLSMMGFEAERKSRPSVCSKLERNSRVMNLSEYRAEPSGSKTSFDNQHHHYNSQASTDESYQYLEPEANFFSPIRGQEASIEQVVPNDQQFDIGSPEGPPLRWELEPDIYDDFESITHDPTQNSFDIFSEDINDPEAPINVEWSKEPLTDLASGSNLEPYEAEPLQRTATLAEGCRENLEIFQAPINPESNTQISEETRLDNTEPELNVTSYETETRALEKYSADTESQGMRSEPKGRSGGRSTRKKRKIETVEDQSEEVSRGWTGRLRSKPTEMNCLKESKKSSKIEFNLTSKEQTTKRNVKKTLRGTTKDCSKDSKTTDSTTSCLRDSTSRTKRSKTQSSNQTKKLSNEISTETNNRNKKPKKSSKTESSKVSNEKEVKKIKSTRSSRGSIKIENLESNENEGWTGRLRKRSRVTEKCIEDREEKRSSKRFKT